MTARRRTHPRAFIGTVLIVLSAMAAFFTPAARVLAAGNSCVTSGPGSYTVSACVTVPADGATVSGTQTVTGTISVPTGTNPGITRAVFFLRGAYVLTDSSVTQCCQGGAWCKWADSYSIRTTIIFRR